MMLKRTLEKQIVDKLWQGKAIIIYGARQVGKTTLLKRLFAENSDALWLNGDDEITRATFEQFNADMFRPIIGEHKILIIDEAQRIKDIGIKLKIIQDNFGENVQVVATGSSSFDLANKINEPLTGRKWDFWLPPLTLKELVDANGLIDEKKNLENRLLYGSYPDVVTHPADARERISTLAKDYLYKDVLTLGEVIKTDKLEKLLQALAFQIGSQVSMNELSNTLGIDGKTVARYISLLEQAFIVFRLPSYGRNLRNELKSSQKIYFYDAGIRNAVIDNYRPLSLRQDIGGLFENYVIAEFIKAGNTKNYFWRTTQQQEVDYLTETENRISAYEIKWNETQKSKLPKTFTDAYPQAEAFVVNKENYIEMLAMTR